ncbi:brother of rumpel [Carabus blaptoides fortunei]
MVNVYGIAFSALTIIGLPYEIYNFGTHYVTSAFGVLFGMFLIWYTILPVFCGNLSIKTPYEYFERRFDYKIRLFCTGVHILHTLMLMPVVLYGPATALSHVTQLPVVACTTFIGAICILYTTIGGFKTVVFTDTLQATLMLVSCVIIAIVGIRNAGGLSVVLNKAQEGNIIKFFDMDPSPLKRITFWTSTFGAAMNYIGHGGCSASALQRYMSVTGLKDAKISTFIGAAGSIAMKSTGLLIGLAMYAIYFKCDPKLNGDIQKANQITSHFITYTLKGFPGFNGLFMAGLLSAALSTLSSELNTIGGLIYYDIISKFFGNKFILDRGMLIIKLIILVNGIIYLCVVPFVQFPHLYELAMRIGGISQGAKIGVLLLGIFFPKINTKGVICGIITSILIMIWINIGAASYDINSYYQYPHSTENCPISNVTTHNFTNITALSMSTNLSTAVTSTIQTLTKPNLEDIFVLYRISVMNYALLGTVITMLVAIIVSYLTVSFSFFFSSLRNAYSLVTLVELVISLAGVALASSTHYVTKVYNGHNIGCN